MTFFKDFSGGRLGIVWLLSIALGPSAISPSLTFLPVFLDIEH